MDIFGIFKQRKNRLDELSTQRQKARKKTGRIRFKSRINEVLDARSAQKLFLDIESADPLEFPDYAEKVAHLSKRSGLSDAFYCATGTIEGRAVVCVELIAEFLMGSMGTAVGEAVCRSAEYALKHQAPLIIFSASGGARMQEGMYSLMQMAKTSAALRKLSDAGILYISVLTHPTTGGVTASFASLGDIILAEPKALIGFAGPRVIEQTIGTSLPEGFQSAEFQQAHGFVDALVARENLRTTLAKLLALHPDKNIILDEGACSKAALNNNTPSRSISSPTPLSKKTPAEHVDIARNALRTHAPFFIKELFDGFFELHGDRLYRDDPAIIGGLALFEGTPVTVVALLKGSDLNENLACNFGMPHPEGYRKFIRLAKQAEKFGRPLITFIDTPGAYPGAEAEQRGQGEAIARCLFELSSLAVPTIAVITGEGGSGGALALGLADKVLMFEYAVYSVLSPEGFASILWKDAKRAADACEVMKLTACDLYGFGMIDAIIKEPADGLHTNPLAAIETLRPALRDALCELQACEPEALVKARYEKYRKF
ncbi:MAG: acetyl-CoA carboxylase carboxyltransferase subunit alpha [Coriobacteriia bacterium]|nr:acetyl-CoA carboxylase carboxyltransferase subunit alpha [Coriobacteriia bacterium]